MKRFGKCLFALIMTVCFTIPNIGCDFHRDNGETVVPDTMTGLYVGNYDGGAGHAWLDEAVRIFEAQYAETSFEEGKVGVKIVVKNDKDPYIGTRLMNDMASNTEDLYITGTISYADFVAAGVLADVTDVMTEKAEGGKSIAERMNEAMQKSFNVGTDDDAKYYGGPSIDSVSGIIYDVDLFESEKLYIGADSVGTDIEWTDKTNKALGMDGKPNTYDDGLPETWEQFKVLMVRMITKNIIPFTWAGMYNTYAARLLNCIWASYEGVDDYMLNYTFDGVDSDVGEINASNGYLLQKQNGKLAALTVAQHIFSDTRFYHSQSPSQSHTDAQRVFLTSAESSSRVAMLCEGSWWENEAKGTFDDMMKYGAHYAYGVRRFAYMPFPKFIGTEGVPDTVAEETAILCDAGSGCVIVSKYTEKLDLAKKFYAFLLSEEIQALLTATTGIPMPYEYDLTATQKSGMTYYAQSIWDLVHDDNVSLIYRVLDQPIRTENTTYFSNWDWATTFTVNGKRMSVREPLDAFYKYNRDGLTAKAYFDALSAGYTKEDWTKTLGKYFS